MSRLKILWMSNVSLTNRDICSSGTWIHSMYNALNSLNEIDIVCNITIGNKHVVSNIVTSDGLSQYEIPKCFFTKNMLPKQKAIDVISQIVNNEKPDIIHIWGTEMPWGLIAKDSKINNICQLLEIQGIKLVCSMPHFFFGGLSYADIKRTKGLMEYLFPSSYALCQQCAYQQWGKYEQQIISSSKNINTQSNWVRSIIKNINPTATIFKTGIILRPEYTNKPTWNSVHLQKDRVTIFSVTSRQTYKAAHITIQAFAIIKRFYPNAILRIAGIPINPVKIKQYGYDKYLLSLISELNIAGSVEFVGNINSDAMINEYYNSDVFVNSSFVETYCLALAEALAIGMPCVASYSSAMVELFDDGVSGLFFPMGDAVSCADRILRILEDKKLAIYLATNASKSMRDRSDPIQIAKQQIDTYKKILAQ